MSSINAVVRISDQCKNPDFREKFRNYFDNKVYAVAGNTFEEAPEDLKFHFMYTNREAPSAIRELYTVTATKQGRTYVDDQRAISYIVHPINIEYEGAYF